MRGLKKRWMAGVLLCLTLCFTGCGKEKLVSEDFQRANCRNDNMNPIMKTDTGYYYNQCAFDELSLHYYDAANGKNMYLCNKPECRHEGDEFCAATSDKYWVMDTVMYSGGLYITAVEKTETAFEYKLLKAALDGSSLSEVVTYFSIDNIDLIFNGSQEMTIHRNKAFLPYCIMHSDNMEIGICGAAIYDMETGELTYLGEKEGDLKVQNENFCGYGDYMYYVKAQKYKNELMRYSYADGSVEKIELKTGFKGNYAIYDENTIFYIRGSGEVHRLSRDTGESTQIDTKDWLGFWEEYETEDGIKRDMSMGYSISSVASDGEYVYVPEGFSFEYCSHAQEKESYLTKKILDYVEVNVLDGEGNFINDIKVRIKDFLGYNEFFTLHFVNDTVYLQTSVMVYECSKADFVAGNTNFKECYPIDIHIRSVKEFE